MKKHLSHLAAALAATMLFGAAVGPLSAAAAAPAVYTIPASSVVSSEENSIGQRSTLNTTNLRLTLEYNTPNPVQQLYLQTAAPYDSVYQWYSTDPSVATVSSNGVVTGLKVGTTTIIANTYTTTLRCTVTVTSNVGKVTLNYSKLALEGIGGSSKLSATVNAAGGGSVTWTSSNPAAAVVDANGVVTAVGNGEATITATASNGRSATCTVYTGTRVAQLRAEQAQADKEDEELVWMVVGGLGVLTLVLVVAGLAAD